MRHFLHAVGKRAERFVFLLYKGSRPCKQQHLRADVEYEKKIIEIGEEDLEARKERHRKSDVEGVGLPAASLRCYTQLLECVRQIIGCFYIHSVLLPSPPPPPAAAASFYSCRLVAGTLLQAASQAQSPAPLHFRLPRCPPSRGPWWRTPPSRAFWICRDLPPGVGIAEEPKRAATTASAPCRRFPVRTRGNSALEHGGTVSWRLSPRLGSHLAKN